MQRRSDSGSYPHNSTSTFFAFKHFVTLSSVFVPDTPITRGNVFFKMSLQIKYICSAKHWYICTLKYISTIYIYYVYVGYVLVDLISYTAAKPETVWLEQRTLHKSRRRQAGSAVEEVYFRQKRRETSGKQQQQHDEGEHNRWLDKDWTKIPTKLTRGRGAGGVRRGNTDELEWVENTRTGERADRCAEAKPKLPCLTSCLALTVSGGCRPLSANSALL